MTLRQRTLILASLRAGCTVSTALKSARLSRVQYDAAVAEDAAFAKEARAAEKQASELPEPQPREPPRKSKPEPDDGNGGSPKWDMIRAEAATLGLGFTSELSGYVRWVEKKCIAAGRHALDPQWRWHLDEFYASGKKVDVGRFGLRAAKSDSICYSLVAEVLLVLRTLEPGLIGVCPIISRNITEANDRTDTIVAILSACGLPDMSGKRVDDPSGFYRSGGGTQARVISLQDSQGHPVEFRIYPASIAAAAGFTAIAGFADEVDLWGRDGLTNPAQRVFQILYTRYTTQPQAKLHVMSATYHGPSTFHARMIAAGDTPLQYVARLGVDGARRDDEARARLASIIGSDDPLLLAKADPNSTDIPSWVSNPIVDIEECYKNSEGNIPRMLSLFGGRCEGGASSGLSLSEIQGYKEANEAMIAKNSQGTKTWDGLLPGDPRGKKRFGGGFGEGGNGIGGSL